MTINLATKGKSLKMLSEVITSARILPIMLLKYSEFIANEKNSIDAIKRQFRESHLIIRSSSSAEDNLVSSNAGHFKSILDVNKDNDKELCQSIRTVFDSYDSVDSSDEVIIQPMLEGIKIAGVVFTADIDTLAPYYIINYDDTGKSDTVTGGRSNSKTYVYYKHAPFPSGNNYFDALFASCMELESICDNKFLDIEFAFDKNDSLYIFQVRPIIVKNKEDLSHLELKSPLSKLYYKIMDLSTHYPHLFGDRVIYGVMPDWNPAEIIGLKPKQLALSLYKEIVTDNIWAYQRDNYGYRNLRSHPLMHSFLGIPYIDVRVDFNSFIPKNLNNKIAEKLVTYYIDQLDRIPTHHDKVEFEIVHSCYYLNLPERLKKLLGNGFNENEIKRIEYALLDLTNNIIDPDNGLYKQDLKKIGTLEEKYRMIIESNISILDKIYWLTEDCKRFGTLPFAGIARAAFIGVQFLMSFIELGIITKNEYEQFMGSLNTVAKKLNSALCEVGRGERTKEDFLKTYGHLRPNTYNILSLRYDESFDDYFSTLPSQACELYEYKFSPAQMGKIDLALMENGIKTTADRLMLFIKESIEGREYSKFVFTRSLSEILKYVEMLGNKYGFKRDELAYIDIRTILNLYATIDHKNIKEIIFNDISIHKESYKYTKAIRLPALIRNAEDIYGFYLEEEEPNFITLECVQGPVVCEDDFQREDVEKKIAFIKSADPGYDYLFTKNISGLVTQFGGANSHMAIRCAEMGIPAVIGAGEKNFLEWSKANIIEIDCSNKTVWIIS
ncbi:MAG TPA: PEP/pyruvate-binding domain-containing protein [Spirochaetota bacterium]|nr:PEP/pyruvate-binding domain-containing protein [Spirochaetota bacterium]